MSKVFAGLIIGVWLTYTHPNISSVIHTYTDLALAYIQTMSASVK